jgi:hypothetical protein
MLLSRDNICPTSSVAKPHLLQKPGGYSGMNSKPQVPARSTGSCLLEVAITQGECSTNDEDLGEANEHARSPSRGPLTNS